MYIPSEEMGDYEQAKNRTRKKSGALFPLDEEGCYGRPPAQQTRATPLPAPLPGYTKRERKPKVYASYAVSNDCCMHAQKLEKNETAKTTRGRRQTPPTSRGRTPPASSHTEPTGPRTKKSSQPRLARKPSVRASDETVPAVPRTKWQNTLRETGPPPSQPARWQDSLRGRDSISPSTPRLQRRPSTRVRPTGRRSSTSVSPNRSRTISTSPDRRMRRQSVSPDRGRMASLDGTGGRTSRGDRGDSVSTDWGYTDFSTFTANRKSMDHSSASTASTTQRKFSTERKTSVMSDRRESTARGANTRESSTGRKESFTGRRESSSGRRESSSGRRESSTGRRGESSSDMLASSRAQEQERLRKSSSVGVSADWRSEPSHPSQSTRISLGALKEASINEWDDLGILGLSSKMFKESNMQKEGYMSTSTTSSSSFFRRESVTTKMM